MGPPQRGAKRSWERLGRLGPLCGSVWEALGGVLAVLGLSRAPLERRVESSWGRLSGLEKRAKNIGELVICRLSCQLWGPS